MRAFSAPTARCMLARLEGVSFVYDARMPFAQPALHAVDLAVEAGEIVALIGSTASGKTTLLQIMAGILVPTSGRMERDASVAMAFQRPEDLLYCASVREDVEAGPAFKGVEGVALQRRVEASLGAVGLDPVLFAGRSSLDLSVGEQRRVALAAILAAEPHLLLLDEPGAGLDGEARRSILAGIVAWVREREERALVFSTHDLDEAAGADRVVLLANGRVTAGDVPVEVLGRPQLLADAGLEAPLAVRLAVDLGFSLPAPLNGPSLGRRLTRRAPFVGRAE